ncbi:MAG: flagellar basal body L-ring protein FlgH [Gammaproteobacteria bacterium]|nr:flagellar basal body L-ring protein FlgH [Gammaproteobacteria bacterium]NND39052.1 flagellar basal body L-ring protein FlgH [Pseudomonadales bacterium]MBT8151258.1 flagellar basal body L-ring protein FlgH [Gammaproteobacteria bacterium]NNL10963.1 flagellar basal body L-ring protein FlgH [Pseudomonadales bacterium]NNM12141.1 flagellar basal body L-ring protein FlgH [Pseudomonadales bacterium]
MVSEIKNSSSSVCIQLLCIVMLVLQGCASYPMHDVEPDSPEYAPVLVPSEVPQRISQGSLYRTIAGLSLYEDRRAYREGDIITVLLTERTVSSKSTETSVGKNSGISIGNDTVLGRDIDFKGHSMETSVGQDRSFDGSGETDQENSLTGSIAVTVSGVLPNGLLVIRGEKWMTLTTGEEFIRVKGLIRPEDISSDNTVSSTKVADARITYSGTGELADASRQGWGSRFFNSRYWPF